MGEKRGNGWGALLNHRHLPNVQRPWPFAIRSTLAYGKFTFAQRLHWVLSATDPGEVPGDEERLPSETRSPSMRGSADDRAARQEGMVASIPRRQGKMAQDSCFHCPRAMSARRETGPIGRGGGSIIPIWI